MKIKTLLHTFFFLLTALLLLTACFESDKTNDPQPQAARTSGSIDSSYLNIVDACAPEEPCGNEIIVRLMAGQHINSGTVTVVNDDKNIYVTYTATNGWKLKATHLYVGTNAALPVNNAGNPQIGNFPFKYDFSVPRENFTYTLPLTAAVKGCLTIAAHAEVVKPSTSGGAAQAETAWGSGVQITTGGSWAMKFEFCVKDCAPGNGGGSAPCVNEKTVNLMAGQNINSGTVKISNDDKNLYVTYTTTNGWKLKATHLYVGACAGIPVNNAGNPKIGNFPYQNTFPSYLTTYTYTIPLSATLKGCICVAAHAEVVKTTSSGGTQAETAWAQGPQITPGGSWAMKVEFCIKDCASAPVQQGCSYSQGYWFAKPNLVWNKPVVVAGFTYTQAEGKAIWNTSNAGGLRDSKACFTQVAAIRCSGITVNGSASVWQDVAICEQWLATLGKLSPSNLPTGNAAAKAAAGRIGDWINANHCED